MTSDPAPSSSDDETATRLRLAVMRLARRLRQQTPRGVTPSQLSALNYLTVLGPLSVSQIAAYEGVRPQTMTRVVDALEVAGWVTRSSETSDGRVVIVRPTDKASQEMEQLRAERNAVLTTQLAGFSADEIGTIVAALPLLERMLDNDS